MDSTLVLLTLVIRITDMVKFTYMSFIVLGATAWIYTLQHLPSPSMDSGADSMHAHGTRQLAPVTLQLSLS